MNYEHVLADIDSVEGLAYDNDHLYFTYQSTRSDKEPAIKYVYLATSEYVATSLISLGPGDAPRAIAVHSCLG